MAYCPICGASVTTAFVGQSSWNKHVSSAHPTVDVWEVRPVQINPFPVRSKVDLTERMFPEKKEYD